VIYIFQSLLGLVLHGDENFHNQLASEEFEIVARRHACYYGDLLEALTQPSARRNAGYSEHVANVRAALDWAFGQRGDIGVGIALARSSSQLFLELSLLTECHHWTERAIAAMGEARGTKDELNLQSALGLSLMFVNGNSDEARDALTRSLALADEFNDAPSQLRMLIRLHFFTERMGDFDAALAFAQSGQLIAEALSDSTSLAAAHSMLGSSYHIMGNHVAARPHLEIAAAQSQISPRITTANYGFDPCTRAAVVLARTLWVMGLSDCATSLATETIARAEASGHPIPICVSLIWAVSTSFGTGHWESVEKNIKKFMDYAERFSLDTYRAVGLGATGKLLVKCGDAAAGVRMLESSLETLHSRRYELHTAGFNSALAEGWMRLGRSDRAIAIVDETMSSIERGGNMFRLPELLRLKGELLCSSPKGDWSAGESYLLQSLRLANQQAALAWELRAASSIGRIWFGSAKVDDARNLLASVYDRFTEGFDCPDLKEARELLNELEQPRTLDRRSSSC